MTALCSRKEHAEQLSELRSWDFITVMGFAMVSTYGRVMAARAIESKRSSFLQRFVPDVSQLVRVMRDTRSVLGGSACLAILHGDTKWVPGDLDIFCPRDGYETFCIFVVDKLGGKVIRHYDSDDMRRHHPNDCPRGVCDRRLIEIATTTFDVMCSNSVSALEPLASSFSTHLMNFISADSVCIAYPWTFSERVGITRPIPGDPSRSLHAKHMERGYRFRYALQETSQYRFQELCPGDGYCCRALRYFGDSKCLSITFEYPPSLTSLYTPVHLPTFGSPAPDLSWTTAWVWGGFPCKRGSCTLYKDPYVQPVVLCDTHRLV